MEVVIRIPKSEYEAILKGDFDTNGYFKANLRNAFKNGVILPEGYEDLVNRTKMGKAIPAEEDKTREEKEKEIRKQPIPTKEECLVFFKELTKLADVRFVPYYKMAIKALEQEPCEDAISRQAVLDNAYAYGNGLEPEGYCVNVEDIQALPPVTPQQKKAINMELKLDKRIIDEAVQEAVNDIKQNFVPKDVLDKIKAEILDEAEYAYADFDKYKEDILYAEPDELPDDDFRYGLRRAIEIINKHKRESEM